MNSRPSWLFLAHHRSPINVHCQVSLTTERGVKGKMRPSRLRVRDKRDRMATPSCAPNHLTSNGISLSFALQTRTAKAPQEDAQGTRALRCRSDPGSSKRGLLRSDFAVKSRSFSTGIKNLRCWGDVGGGIKSVSRTPIILGYCTSSFKKRILLICCSCCWLWCCFKKLLPFPNLSLF